MEIPRSLLDGYTKKLNALSEAGQRLVSQALANAEWNSIAELRSIMSEVMNQVCSVVSDDASVVASEMYDDIRELAVGERLEKIAASSYDSNATDGAVRALLKSVVDTGSTKQLNRDLADRVDYEVKKAAGNAAFSLARQDPEDPRFARVPSGHETCPFCIMLASRGPVYLSERSAGADGHYHAHCDCRIVPFFDSHATGPSRFVSDSMSVEGYDIDVLYDQYVDALHEGRLSPQGVKKYVSSQVQHWRSIDFDSYGSIASYIKQAKDIEDLQYRCAVAESEWAKTGLSDRYYNMLTGVVQYRRWQMQGLYDAEQVTYIKARVDLKDWERKGIDALAKKGKKVVVPEEDPDAPANIDLKVDGALWELKNVTNVSSSVGNQLGRSRKKWWKFDKTTGSRTIFTMYDCKNSAEEIAEAIKKRLRPNENAVLIDENGNIIEIKSEFVS